MSSWNNGRARVREKRSDVSKKDAVICAIALHEERYIDEWIQYHLALGFSHIYLYDNSNDHILKNKNSDKITIIHFPGKVKQMEAYQQSRESGIPQMRPRIAGPL